MATVISICVHLIIICSIHQNVMRYVIIALNITFEANWGEGEAPHDGAGLLCMLFYGQVFDTHYEHA